MKIVTSKEMQEIDRKTIRGYGIPGSVLMERAGLAVAEKIRGLFGEDTEHSPRRVAEGDRAQNAEKTEHRYHKVIVLAGAGNNGGDGIVVARNLHEWGWNVKGIILSNENKLSPDCLEQYKIAKKSGVPMEFGFEITGKDLHSALVVDAIFGTGLSKDVKGKIADVISFVNNSSVPVIAVDIPSGISSDTGQVMGEAVMADYTVTFGLPKMGHFLHPGAEHTGRLFVEDIGFPEELLKSEKLKVELIERKDMALLIPERKRYSHKGDYGHVLIVAGSRGKTGAAFLAAKACLRAGAGLVTIGVPETLMDVFQPSVTEEMTLALPDLGNGTLSSLAADKILRFLADRADVLAIGPGLSVSDDIKKLISIITVNSTVPLVIDADAINSLEGNRVVLKKTKAPVIMTPHTGEMARLLQKGPRGRGAEGSREIEKDRINTAIKFAKETGTYLVFKGVPTIIAEPEGEAFVNSTGNPGMATAGAGDILTGVIAGFLGQGLNPLQASVLGVFMHGLAGDLAALRVGEHSLIASDIIDSVPESFMSLKKDVV